VGEEFTMEFSGMLATSRNNARITLLTSAVLAIASAVFNDSNANERM
jgi:hypothetical protein